MATTVATQMTSIGVPAITASFGKVPEAIWGGRIRGRLEKVVLAAQAAADIIYCGVYRRGDQPLGGRLAASVTLGTSTISLGPVATPAKWRALAVHTTVDQWVPFGIATQMDPATVTPTVGAGLPADEYEILTVATAALPGAGTLLILWEYMRI